MPQQKKKKTPAQLIKDNKKIAHSKRSPITRALDSVKEANKRMSDSVKKPNYKKKPLTATQSIKKNKKIAGVKGIPKSPAGKVLSGLGSAVKFAASINPGSAGAMALIKAVNKPVAKKKLKTKLKRKKK